MGGGASVLYAGRIEVVCFNVSRLVVVVDRSFLLHDVFVWKGKCALSVVRFPEKFELDSQSRGACILASKVPSETAAILTRI